MPLLVLTLTVLSPILGRDRGTYLLVLFVILVPFVLVQPLPKPRLAPFLYIYLYANVLAIIAHLASLDSVLNAGSLVVSILAISGAAYLSVRRHTKRPVEHSLELWLWISLALSLFLSVTLTASGWPGAPDYFPWESFYSEKRFLLINGAGVGHTPALWVAAFLGCFTAYRLATARRYRALFIVLFGLLVACLLATKSRLSLLYVVNLFIMLLAYRRFVLARYAVFLIPVVFSFFFLSASFVPQLSVGVDIAAHSAQQAVGDWLRLTPREESGVTAFSGRDILNRALMSASLEAPLTGQGDDADILAYGIDTDGDIAYDSRYKRAGVESPLRLAVKYGWLYFFALIVFLGSIPLALMKLRGNDKILHLGLWGMSVESIASQGGMEVFYGISGLMLFLLCISLFRAACYGRILESYPLNGVRRAAVPGRRQITWNVRAPINYP